MASNSALATAAKTFYVIRRNDDGAYLQGSDSGRTTWCWFRGDARLFDSRTQAEDAGRPFQHTGRGVDILSLVKESEDT